MLFFSSVDFLEINRRALMFLNLYGCEAVGHRLKNGLKTQKMDFLPGKIHNSFLVLRMTELVCKTCMSIQTLHKVLCIHRQKFPVLSYFERPADIHLLTFRKSDFLQNIKIFIYIYLICRYLF